MTFSFELRKKQLIKMSTTPLDLLIIGGGICGAGIALDGITRGLGVGLVEMQDFAAGSSSRSTKLINSNLTELKEVAQLGRERSILYENGPHVTTPIKVLLPTYQTNTFSPLAAVLRLNSYDLLTQTEKNERSFRLRKADTLKREPYLSNSGLKSSSVFTEYRTDDSRLTLEILKQANDFGAYLTNYTKVEKLLFDEQTGKIIGARVRDLMTQLEYPIYAKRVINATGHWSSQISQLANEPLPPKKPLKKGLHLVINSQRLPITNALYFSSPLLNNGMLYIIPRDKKIYVGSSVTDYHGSLDAPAATKEELILLLNALNQLFTTAELTLEDIETSWTGLYTNEQYEQLATPTLGLSAPVGLTRSDKGLYTIQLTKLTNYRKLAKATVDTILRDICKEYNRLFIQCRTKNLAISGGDVGGSQGYQRYTKEFIRIGIDKFHLSHRDANLLVKKYGSNVIDLFAYLLNVPASSNLPDTDYVMLKYALNHEMCLHPVDFLLRRTSYMLFNISHCQQIKTDVINEMGRFYQWPVAYKKQVTEETNAEIRRYLNSY